MASIKHWHERLRATGKPRYLLIADLIAEDIANGTLAIRDPLPPLRDLARELGLNYSTVARGYGEARRRGLIDSHVGIGTVVRAKAPAMPLRTGTSVSMTMNLPPEPSVPELIDAMQNEAAHLFDRYEGPPLFELLRYQDFGGTDEDRAAGLRWLHPILPDRPSAQLLVCPGAHSALLGLMSMLARAGDTICVESLVYPGTKAIATQLGIRLHALPMDEQGVLPVGFEYACRMLYPRALICTPTIHNPTTATMLPGRRAELADIATHFSVPIIEDDAYGRLLAASPRPLATLAPELTYYIGGLSKPVGAGLRIAYVCAPSMRAAERLAGAMRATSVMASPFSTAIATRWIHAGLAERMLEAVRDESRARQDIARECLTRCDMRAQPESFHLWVRIPENINILELVMNARLRGIPCVSGAAFSTDSNPPHAVRLCLGGHTSRDALRDLLNQFADAIDHPETHNAHIV